MKSISRLIEAEFLKHKKLSLIDLYEKLEKNVDKDANEQKLKHSIRRSIQSLQTRGFIKRVDHGVYELTKK